MECRDLVDTTLILRKTAQGPRFTNPGLNAEKTELTISIQKEYSDDGLPSSWIQYNQTVHHRYILFAFMVSSVFSACSAGLVYLGPKATSLIKPEKRVRRSSVESDAEVKKIVLQAIVDVDFSHGLNNLDDELPVEDRLLQDCMWI